MSQHDKNIHIMELVDDMNVVITHSIQVAKPDQTLQSKNKPMLQRVVLFATMAELPSVPPCAFESALPRPGLSLQSS
jgi:hypothetical protein